MVPMLAKYPELNTIASSVFLNLVLSSKGLKGPCLISIRLHFLITLKLVPYVS